MFREKHFVSYLHESKKIDITELTKISKGLDAVKLTFENGIYTAHIKFEERMDVERAGFTWNRIEKKWRSKDIKVVSKLRAYADKNAVKEINKHLIQIEPWTSIVATTSKKYVFKNHQFKVASYLLSRNRAYNALDAGLGKTPVAAAVALTLNNISPRKTLFICPPFLVSNSVAEFEEWASTLKLARLEDDKEKLRESDVMFIPDSMLARPETMHQLKIFLNGHTDPILFGDEFHRYKEMNAQRSKALFKSVSPLFERVYPMSGTPMPNRPMELFGVLSSFAPECINFMNKFEYGRRYCAGHKTHFGWDFSGQSNMPELQERMKPFMIRIKKSDVDWEKRLEEVVIIADDLPPKVANMDKSILRVTSPDDLVKRSIVKARGGGADDDIHIMTYRRELGVAKARASMDYIYNEITNSTDAFVIFAIHKEVISYLKAELAAFEPAVITGDTKMSERGNIVAQFQKNDCRVFIGNIQAAGIGNTLTKARRAMLVEYSWVPGENSQAIDRIDRIGQTNKVLAQYLVFKNSLDRKILESLLEKGKTQKYV